MSRAKCIELLMGIAQACHYDLTETIIGVYDQSLKPNGYPAIGLALMHVLKNRRQRDPFPTIRELQDLITPAPQVLDQARDAAARIIAALSKYGRYNTSEARAYIGELGWKCVEMSGGFSNLCSMITESNTSTHMAQLRELAATVYRKAEMGIVDQPPALPGPNKALSGFIKAIADAKQIEGPGN
jgi:hypothetical protein